ncbi:MAG: hypothetical protein R8K46_05630 [Mariprofundaceae bacterium]
MKPAARQQLLGLNIPPTYDYGAWIRHAGLEEMHNRLALWLVRGGILWLSSAQPAGKTHVLHALQQEHPHLGLISIGGNKAGHAAECVRQWLPGLERHALWMVDVQAGGLPYQTGIALFHLIERAKAHNRPLLIAWRCDDAELGCPELASRMRGMERIEARPPEDDAALRAVLKSVAGSRQWRMDDAMIDLLLNSQPRRLDALIDAFAQLEADALAAKRAMTLSWLRQSLRLPQHHLPVESAK